MLSDNYWLKYKVTLGGKKKMFIIMKLIYLAIIEALRNDFLLSQPIPFKNMMHFSTNKDNF